MIASHARAELARTEVTTLNHEVLDDTVELRALVTKAFRKLSAILLNTGSQSTEVLDGLGNGPAEQTHFNCELFSENMLGVRGLG